MGRVPKDSANLQYKPYNDLLLAWFNNALTAFPKELGRPRSRIISPGAGNPVTWDAFIYPRAVQNPFLGSYTPTAQPTAPAVGPELRHGSDRCRYIDGNLPRRTPAPMPRITRPQATRTRAIARSTTWPRPSAGSMTSADQLRQCGLNYEIHPNGWLAQWPTTPTNTRTIVRGGPFNYDANQYGRTSFLFGGVPGMQMPVSFYKDPPRATAA